MLLDPATGLEDERLGVALGLFVGKQAGGGGLAPAAVRLGLAQRPAHTGWWGVYGVTLLCGVGFTVSLFIGLRACAKAPGLEAETQVGVLIGLLACMAPGALVLRFAPAGPARTSASAQPLHPAASAFLDLPEPREASCRLSSQGAVPAPSTAVCPIPSSP